jgi:ABC-type polysaccharide/polyol phosphate transport system ATPase subunit
VRTVQDAAPIVLKGVNFGVRMESRIGVVGVNGSGKSTLLKLFTGDLEPTTGDCKYAVEFVMRLFRKCDLALGAIVY